MGFPWKPTGGGEHEERVEDLDSSRRVRNHYEDCFYYCLYRNNVVVLFETLKLQSFVLTEASDCGSLIVVTSSTFLKRKDMLKEKKAVSPDRQNPQPSIYSDKCTLYTYTVYMSST